MIWIIGVAIDLNDPCKDSIFNKRRQVFGTVAQEIAYGGNGIEQKMVVLVVEPFKQILNDLLDMIYEFLAVEGDVANSIDRVLQDSLIFVELTDTLQYAAYYLIFLELLVSLVVVFRKVTDKMKCFLDEKFFLFV